MVASAQIKPINLRKLAISYGSKIGHLVAYIHTTLATNSDAKIILFCAETDQLTAVEAALNFEGIDTLQCVGNVFHKKKAISMFRNGDVCRPVLLLSLKASASGTNLQNATHIILFATIRGNLVTTMANEQQAIGRAIRLGLKHTVEIVRFIVRGTVEHKLYEQLKATQTVHPDTDQMAAPRKTQNESIIDLLKANANLAIGFGDERRTHLYTHCDDQYGFKITDL